MRVHIYDGGSLVGEGEYSPQTSLLSNVSQRGKPLVDHTIALVDKAHPSITFFGNLQQEECGFRLMVNPQT